MKKFIQQLVIILLGVQLASCNNELEVSDTKDISTEDVYHVGIDEALTTADMFFAQLKSPNASTRSIDKRKVSRMEIINTNAKTRGSRESYNKELYLVNYEEDNGFALLSSDKRLCPIYAIADSGHLETSDTIYNKPLALFFKNVMNDISYEENNPTTFEHDGQVFIDSAQVAPLLWAGTRKWSQKAPYNEYCFTENGKQAVAGCSSVSIAQIMSFYSWPQKIDDISLSWRSMKGNRSQNKIARLLARLGQSDMLATNYGESSSGSSDANYMRTFIGMGYYAPNEITVFSESDVRFALDNANKVAGAGPVLTLGRSITGSGHSWVIDGYAQNVTNKNSYSTLFHCVWGWGGKADGYFYWKGYIGGHSDALDVNDYDFSSDKKHLGSANEYILLYYMTNFVPNKK